MYSDFLLNCAFLRGTGAVSVVHLIVAGIDLKISKTGRFLSRLP